MLTLTIASKRYVESAYNLKRPAIVVGYAVDETFFRTRRRGDHSVDSAHAPACSLSQRNRPNRAASHMHIMSIGDEIDTFGEPAASSGGPYAAGEIGPRRIANSTVVASQPSVNFVISASRA